VLLVILAAVVVIVLVLIGSTGWLDALGAAPTGERLARIQRSPNYKDGAFRNPEATTVGRTGSTGRCFASGSAGTSSACRSDHSRSCG
jgi:hypothetical protein